MRDLDLQTLRLFAAVCDQRSIARVAEQESIVGSAISKRLAQLEDTVGTPLLLRKRRGVVPTPAGETLLEHARTMLASVGQIERDMAAYATGTRAMCACWSRPRSWRNRWPMTWRRFCKNRPTTASRSAWKSG